LIRSSAIAAAARDNVQVAGSSTVLPYASIVAEAFGENTDFPTPVVESGGSSAGLKRFCEGVGENTIDIANASRAIRDARSRPAPNGVTDIIEVRIGYDGIVFASQIDGPAFTAFSRPTSSTRWRRRSGRRRAGRQPAHHVVRLQRRPAGGRDPAFIPGTKHGTREVFEEKVLRPAAKPPAPWKR
jgi:phosphate transport system substrate-binding protein